MDMNEVNLACHHQESELRTSCESEIGMNDFYPACRHQESELLTSCESEMDKNETNLARH